MSGSAEISLAATHENVRRENAIVLQEIHDEKEQARIRIAVGTVAFGVCWPLGVSAVWPLAIFFALYTTIVLVWIRMRPSPSPLRRGLAIFGDVVSISFPLYLGGEKTMWAYMIYHFVLIGNSCRYGGPYFWLNESMTLIGFALVCIFTPAWNADLYTAIGFYIALIVNPIYTHIFVDRFRVRDRQHERETVQHEEATLARSRFVGAISHDIRTSLGGMKGAGEILTRIATTDLQRQTLTVFETSYHTLNTLLQELLLHSRMEAGKLELNIAPFDLHAMVRNIELLFREGAKQDGIELRISVSPVINPFLIGDEPKIERILTNVIKNALKFTQQGYVGLHVSPAATAGVLRFEITDTGCGIAADILPHVFEPFTRGDSSTTRTHGGSGLGLSIVREMSEMMRGKFSLTSTVNVGSRFWIDLPLPEDKAPTIKPLVINGAISVYDGCPRDMFEALERQGVSIIDDAQFLVFRRVSPEIPVLARVIPASNTVALGTPTLLPDTRPPLVLLYNNSLDQPLVARDHIALPMNVRWWTNAIRLEAYRRGAHLMLSPHDNSPRAPRGLRILIVDDTKSLLWVTEQILVSEGYEVVTAVNGKIGLELLLNDSDINLAIVDYHMPEMDGMEMIRRFRASSPRGAILPLIMLTASVSHETEQAALAGGATQFLLKPFLANDLFTAIEGLLSSTPAVSTPPSEPETVRMDTIDMPRLKALQNATPVPDFLRKTIELFTLYDAPAALKDLDTATSADALRTLLHTLAGSSANVGAMKFSALCREKMALPDDELTASKDEWAKTIRREMLIVNVELAKAVARVHEAIS